MVSLESKIYSVLSASSAITVLTTRIYPEHRPEADALPAVVYSRLSGLRVNHLRGFSGLENAQAQLEIYSSSVDGRRGLGDVVTAAMVGSTSFSAILVESPFDDYDSDEAVYIRTMNFSIWHQDT